MRTRSPSEHDSLLFLPVADLTPHAMTPFPMAMNEWIAALLNTAD